MPVNRKAIIVGVAAGLGAVTLTTVATSLVLSLALIGLISSGQGKAGNAAIVPPAKP